MEIEKILYLCISKKYLRYMEAQIMKLEAPYDYIYCNGEVGKHIATYIVGESHVDEDGTYTLETHSHPIVQYKNSPKGVVWNRAELTDCEVLCSEADMRVDVEKFFLLSMQRAGQRAQEVGDDYEYAAVNDSAHEAVLMKERLRMNGMGFKSDEEVVEVGVEVGKCSDGYFAQLVDVNIMFFHYIEPTLDELGKRLTWEREFWEEFYDYVVKIKYTPESTLARGFVEEL